MDCFLLECVYWTFQMKSNIIRYWMANTGPMSDINIELGQAKWQRWGKSKFVSSDSDFYPCKVCVVQTFNISTICTGGQRSKLCLLAWVSDGHLSVWLLWRPFTGLNHLATPSAGEVRKVVMKKRATWKVRQVHLKSRSELQQPALVVQTVDLKLLIMYMCNIQWTQTSEHHNSFPRLILLSAVDCNETMFVCVFVFIIGVM